MSGFDLEPVHRPQPVDLLVVGGGPAGLCAALEAAPFDLAVLVVDDGPAFGGQLVKQTHKFFGSKLQLAGTRGLRIGQMLHEDLAKYPNVVLWHDSRVLGVYPDGVVTVDRAGIYGKFKPERTVIAAGAAEKFLAFPGNDLPGVYGAGAVQTLMNVHGVLPAERLLMVGAGNIGLIVSYQLLQAGCEVAAVVEGLPVYGGYQVHASKLTRAGVPILVNHTIARALGEDRVTGAVIVKHEDWVPIPGTEREIACDAICLAVGLSPQNTLARMARAEHVYVGELGGWVPKRRKTGETTVPGLYVAGDCAGVEEATSAMIEGRIAGIDAAQKLGKMPLTEYTARMVDLKRQLEELRSGPISAHIRAGLEKVMVG
jgi:sarcosine oxidase subunit alpha